MLNIWGFPMKILIILFLIINVFANTEYQDDIDKAFSLGKKQNKLVYVLVYTDACPWCHRMRNKVLKDKTTIKALENYIIAVVYKKSISDPKFATILYPTSFLVDPSDNNYIIQKLLGFTSSKALNKILNESSEIFN